MRSSNLKPFTALEKEFCTDGDRIRIPLHSGGRRYGVSRIEVEPIFNKRRLRPDFDKILITIPHLVQVGETANREIECHGTSIDVMEGQRLELMWCGIHHSPLIRFHPPDWAKFMTLWPLHTSFTMSIEFERGE